VTVSLLDI